jgi:hypothetical protein
VSEQVACDLHSILLQNISNCNTVDFPAWIAVIKIH